MEWMLLLAVCVHTVWVYTGIIILVSVHIVKIRIPSAIRWLFHELKPFYLPAVGVEIIDSALHGEVHGWNIIWLTIAIATWWFYKDLDEDDRWKKRRKKLSEKISRVGSKLVVVPANS